MKFSEQLKKEREKRNWSQSDLAEKIHVSRQTVSKWETGNPSIEIIITLSDLLEVSIDKLLKGDEKLKKKIIQDSKQLAYPKWKGFFDCLFLLGVTLLIGRLVITIFNSLITIDIHSIVENIPHLTKFLPIILIVIGIIGSKELKNKYTNE